jgi:hypothetical protein
MRSEAAKERIEKVERDRREAAARSAVDATLAGALARIDALERAVAELQKPKEITP